jgi:NTP pyrophosphatase (non-canonical NTP hydrolase)
MRDYKALLEAGNKAQLEKLKQNEHKKDFESVTFEYAYNRLVEEMIELKEAFSVQEVNNEGFKNIRQEAADVANFAHMIIYRCDQIF